jgi:alkaline phosphatase D
MSILKSKYDKLGAKPFFKRLKRKVPVMATWDDHDYGKNDAGKNYPKKEESKEIFLSFWNIPDSSNRRLHKGIYESSILGFDSLKIQLILLDTRTFRDNLTKTTNKTIYKNKYQPTISPDSTFLGNEQWLWLEKQLKLEADIRIIATSNQFSAEYTGWESWTNVPYERKKMLSLIKSTKSNGVVFISGDIHFGEISKYTNKDTYPLYDITSSSLAKSWRVPNDNINRIGNAVIENNFGIIEIRKGKNTNLTFNLINKLNISVVKYQINLSDIGF